MIRKLTNLKIRYQFGLIIAMSVLLVLIVQTIYYIEVTHVTKSRIELFTKSSIGQVVNTTNLILDKAGRAALYFAYSSNVQSFMGSSDPFDIFITKKYIEDMITTAVEINLEIENVVLLNPELKRIYYYNDTQVYSALDQIEQILIQNVESTGLLYLQGDAIENRDFVAYIMPVIYAAADARRGEKLGSIVVFLKPEALRNIISQAAPSEQVELMIVDFKGQVVASNAEHASVALATRYPEGDEIAFHEKIGSTGWNMVGVIKPSNVVKDYDFFKSFAMVIGFIMILLLALLGWVFHRSFAKPVSQLLNEIGKIGDEEFGKVIVTPYQSEIGGIALHINRMLKKLDMMNNHQLAVQKRVYQIEISRQQTELYALQSQVNPHFLFNTLQSIGGIAYARDVPEIAEMTVSMAEIFKYGIKGEDEISIRDEAYIVEQYMKIIDIRFAGRFEWSIQLPHDMLDMVTIKMILQPLVENAVYHGLEKLVGHGSLIVEGRIEYDCIIIEIRDNGPGIPVEELARIRQLLVDPVELERAGIGKQNIGIANIQWRIRLKYGERFGLQVISGSRGGTLVRVRLPKLLKI